MKQLFIKTMLSMADSKTVFTASHEFWANIYDRITAGQTENIDQTFITIYQALKAADQIQNNYRLSPKEEFIQERRILLSAIEQRLKGKWVTVICHNPDQARLMQELFFKLVGDLKPLLNQRGSNVDLLAKGHIQFKAVRSIENQGFQWSNLRILGGDSKDVVYIMPSAVHEHYAPLLTEYKRNSKLLEASECVATLERYLEHIRLNRDRGLDSLLVSNMVIDHE